MGAEAYDDVLQGVVVVRLEPAAALHALLDPDAQVVRLPLRLTQECGEPRSGFLRTVIETWPPNECQDISY